jgi:tetratricopeptide (TPR) repeat protein
MTKPVITSTKRLFSLKNILVLSLFILCLRFILSPLPAADTWWMLKTGEVIVNSGEIPHYEMFSHTAENLPWLNHEWLAAAIFYIIYAVGNLKLLYIFTALIILSVFFVTFRLALIKNGKNVAAAAVAGSWMLAISGGALYFDIRAYIFSYLFLALTLILLEKGYYGSNKKILLLLLPITLLWVNMHGAFILSYVLQVMFLAAFLVGWICQHACYKEEKVLKEDQHDANRSLHTKPGSGKFWSLFAIFDDIRKVKQSIKYGVISLAGSIAAGFINPHTYRIFSYPFTLWGDSFYRSHLNEWAAPDYLGKNLPMLISVVVIFVLSVGFYKKLKLTEFFIIAGFSFLALKTVRHSVLYSIALLPVASVITAHLAGEIGAKWNKLKFYLGKVEKVIAIAGLLVLIVFSYNYFSDISTDKLSMEQELFPYAGVEFLNLNPLPGRMYNPYEWGGYFAWRLYPDYKVFIDGRANTVYPEEVYRDSIFSMQGEKNWPEIMDKYDINFVFCNKFLRDAGGHRLPDRLQESPDWVLIFEDDVEMLFIRNEEGNREIIEKAENDELRIPRTPYQLNRQAVEYLRRDKISDAEALLKEALDRNPRYTPALFNMGYAMIMQDKKNEAEKLFKQVLKISSTFPMVNYNLGIMSGERGDIRKAKRYFNRELTINPEFEPAKLKLQQLETEN